MNGFVSCYTNILVSDFFPPGSAWKCAGFIEEMPDVSPFKKVACPHPLSFLY